MLVPESKAVPHPAMCRAFTLPCCIPDSRTALRVPSMNFIVSSSFKRRPKRPIVGLKGSDGAAQVAAPGSALKAFSVRKFPVVL